MEWTDEGIVLGIRRHGEANAIVELMTREHGRHLGLVRGGAGSRMRPVLQPGNSLRAVWRARLDEHLGTFAVEGLQLRAGSFLTFSHAVYAVTHLGAHDAAAAGTRSARKRLSLPAGDPRPCRRCRVDRGAGRAFRDRAVDRTRLRPRSRAMRGDRLVLRSRLCVAEIGPRGLARRPARNGATNCSGCRPFCAPKRTRGRRSRELGDGFALSGYFLARHVLEPRGLAMPDARQNFIAAIARAMPDAA